MKSHRKTSHAVYDIKFHIVWITKYRKPVLHGEVAVCNVSGNGNREGIFLRETMEYQGCSLNDLDVPVSSG
jgi:REP element-mobilizing transposase RayT